MESINKLVGRRIRKLRLEHDLTQDELAEQLNLHNSYIGLLERGLRSPSLDTLSKIATFFKIPLASLLVDEGMVKNIEVKSEELFEIIKDKSNQEIEILIKIGRIIFP
ncbi:MAG: helix-turn-helix transcriptional regulator [bacterium]